MKLPYSLLLTAATLLTACSKKDEEVLPPEIDYSAPVAPPGYVTYNRDGVVTSRPASARYEAATPPHPADDWLRISETNPATGTVGTVIIYGKPAGAAADKFVVYWMPIEGYSYSSRSDTPPCTLTKTSAGWSGTFA
ncbi:hypothetical protein, partial [Hymenobacter persicinus]